MFSDSPLFHREKNIFITNTEHLKEYSTSVHPQMYSVKVDFKGLPLHMITSINNIRSLL